MYARMVFVKRPSTYTMPLQKPWGRFSVPGITARSQHPHGRMAVATRQARHRMRRPL